MNVKQNLKSSTYHAQKCLPYLGMAYIIFIIVGFLFVEKGIQVPYVGIVSTGAFVLPMSFIVTDIIAEAYGYIKAKQIIISGIIAQGLFCFLCYVLLHLHSAVTNPQFASQTDYQKIFGELPRIYISTTIALISSNFLNARLLTKWQRLLKGKYFWLRSIGSSSIGEGIFTLIAILLICVGRYPISLIFQFFVLSYLAKIITTIIFAYPANMILILLRKYENIQHLQRSDQFNPFKSLHEEKKNEK